MNMIFREQLLQMRKDALTINDSHGGIINEDHPYKVIIEGHLGEVAIDAFDNEPNTSRFIEINRFLLTAHMGLMSIDCRSQIEIEEPGEVINFLTGYPLKRGSTVRV